MNVEPISPVASKTTESAAFAQAVRLGWMSGSQYGCIAEELLASPGCSLLVFGIGYDSLLWSQCVTGALAFIEDNPKYLTLAPPTSRIVLYQYGSCVGRWFPLPDVPCLVDRSWDYVLVDGPAGFGRRRPGRQFPIEWSRRLATRGVFVHDYQRPWERLVCNRVWGAPSAVISATGSLDGDLAVFRLPPSEAVLPPDERGT